MLVTLKHGNHVTLITIIIMLNYTSEWSITQVAVTLGVIWVTEIIVCMRIMFIVNNRPHKEIIVTYPHAIFKNSFIIHYLSLSRKSAQNVNIFYMVNVCFLIHSI